MDRTQWTVFAIGVVLLIAVVAVLAWPGEDGAADSDGDAEEVEAADPDLTISTDSEMDAFLSETEANAYSGMIVALAADVNATECGGTFCGTLLGNGHAVTCDLETQSDSIAWVALFLVLSDAAVSDLTLEGTVGTAGAATQIAAGLCYAAWDCTFSNVVIDVSFNVGYESTDSTGATTSFGVSAGIVAEADSCVFESCDCYAACVAYDIESGETVYDAAGSWLAALAADCTFAGCGCDGTSGVYDDDGGEEDE